MLASIGVYGVIAYAVGQRSREFGIRLALGARRSEIVRGVLRRGVAAVRRGRARSVWPAAAASARVLGSLLFNVSGFDPVSFAAATASSSSSRSPRAASRPAARRASIRRSPCGRNRVAKCSPQADLHVR